MQCKKCGQLIAENQVLCFECQKKTEEINKSTSEVNAQADQILFQDGQSGTEQVIVSESGKQEKQIKFAGFWIRLAANFIDMIIIFVIVFILNLVFSVISWIPALGIVMDILFIIFPFAYFIYMTKKYQATLGKMALGVIVVKSQLQPLSVKDVFMRELLGKIVSGLTLNVGYIIAGFTQKKQALHDYIADTVVIYNDPAKGKKTSVIVLVIIGAILGVILIAGILGGIFFVSLNSARTRATEAAFKSEVSAYAPVGILCCEDKSAKLLDQVDGKTDICSIPLKRIWNQGKISKVKIDSNCNNGNFSFTVFPVQGTAGKCQSAVCTASGCVFNGGC